MTVVGPPGPPGKNGLNGTDGQNGRDGKDGRDGRDGPKVLFYSFTRDQTLAIFYLNAF